MAFRLGQIGFHFVGIAPLLMHNERLANPMDPATKRLKALTSKRKKTDEDQAMIARAEFDGALYIDQDGPFVPDHWVMALLRDAGKLIKLGKAITQGVLIQTDKFPLELTTPLHTAEELWEAGCYDQRMVGNQRARILRTRPRFNDWQIRGDIFYDQSMFDDRQLLQIMDLAGVKIGLGDYRPRFGRFEARNV